MTLNSCLNLLVKSFVRCWRRPAIQTSLKMNHSNIRKYHVFFDVAYSEAFVIHCTHDTATFYYCNMPNDYLAAIYSYGAAYLETVNIRPSVMLRHTRKYHFREPTELFELFLELTNLLCYLSSGKAHVGYLFDYPGNPLKALVQYVVGFIDSRFIGRRGQPLLWLIYTRRTLGESMRMKMTRRLFRKPQIGIPTWKMKMQKFRSEKMNCIPNNMPHHELLATSIAHK
jgi:hypothetical protein